MPGTARNASGVGRFPGVTFSNGNAAPEEAKVMIENEQEEGGCRRWLRRVCPCCCRKKSSSYEVSAGESNAIDGKEEEKPAPLPEPAQPQTDDSELKGTPDATYTLPH